MDAEGNTRLAKLIVAEAEAEVVFAKAFASYSEANDALNKAKSATEDHITSLRKEARASIEQAAEDGP